MTFESCNVDDLTKKIEDMWKLVFDFKAIAEMSLKQYNAETTILK